MRGKSSNKPQAKPSPPVIIDCEGILALEQHGAKVVFLDCFREKMLVVFSYLDEGFSVCRWQEEESFKRAVLLRIGQIKSAASQT